MTSMDYYTLDKHCQSILSPPVISSTSCVARELNSNESNGHYLNGGAYTNPSDSCMSNGHSFGREGPVKMASAGNVAMFDSNEYSSYYGLDTSHTQPVQHQPQSHLDEMKKGTLGSFHLQSGTPVYTNIGCSTNGGGDSTNKQSAIYPAKEEYESCVFSMQQCAQSSTSPIITLPDSPPIVSSNSGYHSNSSQHTSPSNSQRNNLCVAKKSSTTAYEMKREIPESSGLSLTGTPYNKSRTARKGTSNITNNTTAPGPGSSSSSGDTNQFTDADSNSGTPSSKQFVPCKVCGDKASGYHYGVTSCEGCKGFFRRSIQKQIEYRCLRDGKCMIIRLNRNRCQFCRFKKCLAVGMSRDSVRYGRVPKKSKEKERLEEKANGVTQAEADQSSVVDIDSKDLTIYDTILTISQAHHANCSYTDEKIKGLPKKSIFSMTSHVKSDNCSSSPDVGSVSESLEKQKIELWEHLALLITPCIQRVVEFAKRIPGFSDLTQDDQLILIKLGFFEVWLVHISKTVNFIDNTLTFADGSSLDRKQLELMFNQEFVGNIFHLMSALTDLNLNDTEIGLFSAIILLQSDRPQIYDIKAINKIQETVVEALKVQINRHHLDEAQTFSKLMLTINELRALGSSHSLHLQWFRSNWPLLKLPPLFAEIFDIPRGNSFMSTVQPSSSGSQSMSAEVTGGDPPGQTNLALTPSDGSLSSPLQGSNLMDGTC